MDSYTATIRQLRATIDMLDAALLALGATDRPVPSPWMMPLTPSQRALMGALYGAYPRLLSTEQLLSILPCKSGDEIDRQPHLVAVCAHWCRKALGQDAIFSERGVGYRMGHEFYNSIPKKPLDKAA